jgi:hypothetical protein
MIYNIYKLKQRIQGFRNSDLKTAHDGGHKRFLLGTGMNISETHNKRLSINDRGIKTRNARGFICAIIVLAFSACPNYYPPKQEQPEETPPFVWDDALFVSGTGEDGKERTIFRTNSERYWTLEGMTIWTVGSVAAREPFAGRTVTMGKSLGFSGGGYGIVFCQKEYAVNGKTTPSMLVAMVNNEGQYILGRATGGVFTDYGWWKQTPYLNRGAGAANVITVAYDEKSGDYRLDINGHFIERFRDGGEPELKGGKNGYIVVISPFDKFPSSGIDVYFMEDP